MGETTKIEWADHINPDATGRVLGAYKSAAKKIGCSVEHWIRRRMAGERWCFRCRSWGLEANFNLDPSRRGGRASTCKRCVSEASTASRYGMTIEEFRVFKDSRKTCEICGSTESLVVDHCHATGKVRGRLCHNCNSAIGKLREDPALFASALLYLETHNGR